MTKADRETVLREIVAQQRATLIVWDWKEQIPINEVSLVAKRGFVHMHMVDNTGGDSCAMIASQEPLLVGDGVDEVQQVFEMLEDAHSPLQYRKLSLEIEILDGQDATPITSALSFAMGALESTQDINDWCFVESPAYEKVEA